jgi:hypothetical protein
VAPILDWAFPVGGVKDKAAELVPTFDHCSAGIAAFVDTVASAGRNIIVKGLPLCYLGERKVFTVRTQNRYYVDRNRQFDKAVMFLSTELPFERFEACCVCSASERCDGFWGAYLALPGFPPL